LPWLTAATMCAIYLYHIPLMLAIVYDAGGLRFGVGAFEPRFALRNAKKRAPGKKRLAFFKKPRRVRAVLSFGARLLRDISLDTLRIRVTLGTGDAARTAQICGLLSAICYTLHAAARARGEVRITPDFANRTLSGEACGILRLRAGHIMKAAAMVILRGTGG
jgi:hypothetical protein